MSPLSLLVCLAGAIDLGSWDFQPWNAVAPHHDPVGSPLIATHRIRGILESRDASGTLLDRDTLRWWTDERGVCRSARWWRFGDSTREEALDLFGMKPGVNALPPDSGWTSLAVAGRIRETGRLSSQHSGQRSLWVYSVVPPPEEVHFDWDSTIVDRDAQGRIVAKREIWTGFAWSSDSIEWAPDGSPSRWITRSGGGWTDLLEIHTPRWSAGRLVQDDVLSVTEAASTASDTSAWRVTCSWVADSLLRFCTTTLLHSNTTTRSFRRRFDSVVVVRDEELRPRSLESFLEGKLAERTLLDPQGRSTSRRSFDVSAFNTGLSLDTSRYGDLPWPAWNASAYRSAKAISDEIPLEEITTFLWDLEPNPSKVSRPDAPHRVRLVLAENRLQLEAPSSPTGLLRLLDPAGRERARANVSEGRASVVLPTNGGVWIWRLTDAEDREIQRGRVAIP